VQILRKTLRDGGKKGRANFPGRRKEKRENLLRRTRNREKVKEKKKIIEEGESKREKIGGKDKVISYL